MKHKPTAGITLLETVLVISIFAVISVASVWLVFASLNLRDQALATTQTQEALRIFSHSLRQAITNASSISGDSTSLYTTSADDCWSFVYDSLNQNLRYDQISSASCTPNQSPTTAFFPNSLQVTSLTFATTTLSTGGRQVVINANVLTALPFNSYQTTLSETVVNLVD